jgi:hypothetical protein
MMGSGITRESKMIAPDQIQQLKMLDKGQVYFLRIRREFHGQVLPPFNRISALGLIDQQAIYFEEDPIRIGFLAKKPFTNYANPPPLFYSFEMSSKEHEIVSGYIMSWSIMA